MRVIVVLFWVVLIPHFLFAQWEPVADPIAVNSKLLSGRLSVINQRSAWFTNTARIQSISQVQVLQTTNAGQSWRTVSPVPPQGSEYHSVSLEAIDERTAWLLVVREAGSSIITELLHTTDAGNSWQVQSLPEVTPFFGLIHFFNLTDGILLDRKTGTGHRTTNGGQTWQPITRLPKWRESQMLSINLHETDELLWTTVNDQFSKPIAFWKSTDQGNSWRELPLPTTTLSVGAGQLMFRNQEHGLLCASEKKMFSTKDGGLTWQAVTAPPFNILAFTRIPGTSAYIAGAIDYSMDLTTSRAGRGSAITYDDGQTWKMMENTNSYYAMQFTAPDAGWQIRAHLDPAVEDILYESVERYNGLTLPTQEAKERQLLLEVFPNPSTAGVFTVRLPASISTSAQIRVMSLTGQVVLETSVSLSGGQIDLRQQPKGAYFLELRTPAGQLVRQRLLSQ